MPKQWNGVRWVTVPEFVFDGYEWSMVNPSMRIFTSSIFHRLNYDNTVGVVSVISNITMFNNNRI